MSILFRLQPAALEVGEGGAQRDGGRASRSRKPGAGDETVARSDAAAQECSHRKYGL